VIKYESGALTVCVCVYSSGDFLSNLKNPARPSFFFGTSPPREGTTMEKAKQILEKFCARSAVLATDGFIVSTISIFFTK
jgi:hypothetical protein